MAKKRKVKKKAAAKGTVAQRALGPAAESFGKEIAPLGKEAGEVTVKVGRFLMSPIKGLVWGLEKIGVWLRTAVSARLKGIPKEKIVEPNPRIIVPAVQALVYSMKEEFIREMFANLIAADMNADKKEGVHPAFVELIKEMTSQDAKVLSSVIFRGGEDRSGRSQILFRIGVQGENTWQHLDTHFSFGVTEMNRGDIGISVANLVRLGLIQIREMEWPSSEAFETKERAVLVPFEEMAQGVRTIPNWLSALGLAIGSKVTVVRSGIYATEFGTEFWKTCMNN